MYNIYIYIYVCVYIYTYVSSDIPHENTLSTASQHFDSSENSPFRDTIQDARPQVFLEIAMSHFSWLGKRPFSGDFQKKITFK